MSTLSSPFPWVGGKRLLRSHIISQIPEHTCYAEPFVGGAWVFWGKEPSRVEAINDINNDLVNLYRQIQTDPEEFYEKLWWLLNARSEYYRILEIMKDKPEDLSDLDRAVYYFFVIKHAFGGRFGSGYAFSKTQPPRGVIKHESLLALSNRLASAHIENLPYNRFIKNYDSAKTFFYCDPPYTMTDGKVDFYQHNFTEGQHTELRDKLAGIEGKFLLSYDDSPLIRDLYKGFKIEKTKPIQYTLNQNKRQVHELLIRNY